MIAEFTELSAWKEAVKQAGLQVLHFRGVMEDPYDHYYAVKGNRYGYFGDANGQDATCGFLATTCREFNIEFGEG